MGIFYEHWRPDLNECFYVGISTSKEKTRPYEMSNRNSAHLKVQEELKLKNLKPHVKIQAYGLTKEELFELEKMQISYWKNLIGSRLSNIHPGGNSGDGIKWSENSKNNQSKRMKDFHNSEKGKKVFKSSLIKISKKIKEFAQTEKGMTSYKERGEKISNQKSKLAWLDKNFDIRNKIKTGNLRYASSVKGKFDYKTRGEKIGNSLNNYFSSDKGRQSAMLHSWWLSNVKTRNYWGA